VRRDPADADAHFVLAASLDSTGAATEAGGERELARRLSAAYGEGEDRPSQGTTVPPNLERVSTFLRRPESGRTDSALVATGQREQQEMATFHLDRGRRFYEREDDRSALTELQRVIYLSPYQSEAHLLVGRIHLRNGRTREAIEALKISLWSEETAAAHQALAEAYVQAKDYASARKEAERALALSPGLTDATKLLQQLGSQPPKAP
jgi:tetratricopeptide (TPR) repeat protein